MIQEESMPHNQNCFILVGTRRGSSGAEHSSIWNTKELEVASNKSNFWCGEDIEHQPLA